MDPEPDNLTHGLAKPYSVGSLAAEAGRSVLRLANGMQLRRLRDAEPREQSNKPTHRGGAVACADRPDAVGAGVQRHNIPHGTRILSSCASSKRAARNVGSADNTNRIAS